jgi:hypothetical protein
LGSFRSFEYEYKKGPGMGFLLKSILMEPAKFRAPLRGYTLLSGYPELHETGELISLWDTEDFLGLFLVFFPVTDNDASEPAGDRRQGHVFDTEPRAC